MSTAGLLQSALAHHRAGRLAEAEALYDAILAQEPDNLNAVYLGGVLLHQTGRHAAAVPRLERAIAARPDVAAFHSNLGDALRMLGHHDRALAAFDRALELEPDMPEALANRAAIEALRGDTATAAAHLRAALARVPDRADAHHNLGLVLLLAGDAAGAARAFEAAVALAPTHAASLVKLATIAVDRDEAEALRLFAAAAAADPGHTEAICGEANLLARAGRTGEAARVLAAARARLPGNAEILSAQAALEMRLLRLDEGLALVDQVLDELYAADPVYAAAMESMRLMYMLYPSSVPVARVRAALAQWNARYAVPHRASWRAHDNDRDPDRRLRIGYISGDFRSHVVGLFFIGGVLRAHDRARVHVTVYSNVPQPDETTRRLQLRADVWRAIRDQRDEAVASMVRDDAIDVLLDLSGHTEHNRMGVLARRPAPVQVTWLGFPGTTGVEAIDWRLSDAICDPPDEDVHSAERVWRLPGFHSYTPLRPSPLVSRLPALARPFTFGSFNSLLKVSDAAGELFARVLEAVPGARLVLKSATAADADARARIGARITRHGIAESRVEVRAALREPEDALAVYGEIDLALDTFPYSGTTTTLEALWMGVPVVTLLGDRHAARVSASLLTQVGLPEFIARTPDEYVAIAASWASRIVDLAALRAGLRRRLEESRLMDAGRVTRELEDAYRGMWRDWCARP